MKILFTGTGNAVCYTGRAGACTIISSNESDIICDFSPQALLNIEKDRVDISGVDHIIITHLHGDHFGGLPYLFLYMRDALGRKNPLYVTGPSRIQTIVEQLTQLLYPGISFPFDLVFSEINPDDTVELASTPFSIKAFKTDHTDDSLGFIINDGEKKIAITGDTTLTPEIEKICPLCDMFITECTLIEPIANVKHISAPEIFSLASENKEVKIVAIHSDEKTAKSIQWPENLIFPNDMTIEII
ncbi:MAG: ribonuclease Z [Deltaproteobacteria bacterium]|nr:ribonuclease Z [Deltaproteobacteria bacterium]